MMLPATLCCLAATAAMAYGINFFLKIGLGRSLGLAIIAVATFLIFCASGMWEGASRHDWGKLAPVFALMLIAGFLCYKYGAKLWGILRKEIK